MFRSVLIANRGEIALRIIRACRELGVRSVVAHSDADRGAPWLEHAHAAICIGPARAEDSYLDADAVLQAAEQCECQAVHPGYGFLAENALFAARCEQQGVTFIGPTASAIRQMGDKAQAKATMKRAGLQTIPGSTARLIDASDARRLAEQIGYPVLLKASAGGGGRGMRLCADDSVLSRAFGEAAREAEKSFGDAGLYLEKYVERARHVEFQVLCDAFGGAVHLGERDCSIQRKHQKLVEESPSPAVDEPTRRRIGAKVCRALARLGYRNAGTVEFLRDAAGNFYFMEMNTRLQVEHPVTEAVTGIDLVVEQLRIAANRPLSVTQKQIEIRGHAIEFRINAEDPERGFAPDPGEIRSFREPPPGDGVRVRWDSAIQAGYRIPPHYDSMVGKLIVHGPDRRTALSGAAEALRRLEIGGVRTTIDFHRRLLENDRFRRGDYDTGFLGSSGLVG